MYLLTVVVDALDVEHLVTEAPQALCDPLAEEHGVVALQTQVQEERRAVLYSGNPKPVHLTHARFS